MPVTQLEPSQPQAAWHKLLASEPVYPLITSTPYAALSIMIEE